MPDSKITALTSIGTGTDPAVDPLVIVDISDTTMAASGTTKKVTLNNLLASSPTATLASATITGDLTVSTAARFNGGILAGYVNGSLAFGSSGGYLNLYGQSNGLLIKDNSGVYNMFSVANTGVFTFGDGAGGTRMTLNSTGLGVGVTPTQKFTVLTADAAQAAQFRAASAYVRLRPYVDATNGAILDATNTAESAYSPLTILASTLRLFGNNANGIVIDANGNSIFTPSATPPTLSTNGQLTVNATSNTNLRFSYRGSDGVTRVANLTLA